MMLLDSVRAGGGTDAAAVPRSGTARAEVAKDYGDFAGTFEFEFEGEKAVIKFTIKSGKLYAHAVTDDYEVGELTPDKKKPNLFRGTTVHGEHWAFEFIKETEGKPVRCKFIDEDFGLNIIGIRVTAPN